MKKSKFVPTADQLESRIALSGGPKFTPNGAAILTSHALGQTYGQIQKAFVNFAKHGHGTNYVTPSRPTWPRPSATSPGTDRDGLLATVKAEAQAVRANIASQVPKPVVTEMQNTLAEVKEFHPGRSRFRPDRDPLSMVRSKHSLRRLRHRSERPLARCRIVVVFRRLTRVAP